MTEGFESCWPELKAWPVAEGQSWVGIKDRLPAEIIGVVKISCMLVTGWWEPGARGGGRSIILESLSGYFTKRDSTEWLLMVSLWSRRDSGANPTV